MQLNLTQQVKSLDGSEIQEAWINKLVANTLVQSNKGDALKFYNWALKLYNDEILDIDASDFETLKNFIKNHDQLTILVKAQVLELLIKQNN